MLTKVSTPHAQPTSCQSEVSFEVSFKVSFLILCSTQGVSLFPSAQMSSAILHPCKYKILPWTNLFLRWNSVSTEELIKVPPLFWLPWQLVSTDNWLSCNNRIQSEKKHFCCQGDAVPTDALVGTTRCTVNSLSCFSVSHP